MREYIHSIMLDKRNNVPAYLIKIVLSILAIFYLFVITARDILYRLGIFKAYRVEAKVISVGNLTLGGTGKTPFSMMLAKLLNDEMRRSPAVLTRGYGMDEKEMLERNLGEVPLFVGPDRVESARAAISTKKVDTIILDDGFQHRRLARDLNILLVDAGNPFGNRKIFPRGILREPTSSVKRADIVVLTKTDKTGCDPDAIKRELSGFKPGLVFLEARHRPEYLMSIRSGERAGLEIIKGKKARLVSSIGDPDYFEETVASLGAIVTGHFKFPDHHDYREADLAVISDDKESEMIITTEKDAVKLKAQSVYVLHIEMEITKGREELVARLNSLYNSQVS